MSGSTKTNVTVNLTKVSPGVPTNTLPKSSSARSSSARSSSAKSSSAKSSSAKISIETVSNGSPTRKRGLDTTSSPGRKKRVSIAVQGILPGSVAYPTGQTVDIGATPSSGSIGPPCLAAQGMLPHPNLSRSTSPVDAPFPKPRLQRPTFTPASQLEFDVRGKMSRKTSSSGISYHNVWFTSPDGKDKRVKFSQQLDRPGKLPPWGYTTNMVDKPVLTFNIPDADEVQGLENFQSGALQYCIEHKSELWPGKHVVDDTLSDNMYSLYKPGVDGYDASMRANLPEDMTTVKVLSPGKPPHLQTEADMTEIPIEDIGGMRWYMVAIVLKGMYFQKKKFGITTKLDYIVLYPEEDTQQAETSFTDLLA